MLYLDRIHELAAKALAAGAIQRSATRIVWDVAGSCQSSRIREVYGRPSLDHRFHGVLGAMRTGTLLQVDLHVRCRNCKTCLQLRAKLWRNRAEKEFALTTLAGGRTWFGTLTLSPKEQLQARYEAIEAFNSGGGDPDAASFEGLSEGEQFALVHAQISKKITLYLKRLRKSYGEGLRYVVVC